MNSCFAYTRVSTAKQGEGVSLDAQRDAIAVFAAHNNLVVTKWFEEKETAAKCGRPIFDSLVKSLASGEAGGLIVHKIDRSARNFADWVRISDLADNGVNIHFAHESLDLGSRGGRLTAEIQMVIASDYIRNLREETIKGLEGRLKQGLYPWGAPIGYLNQGGGKPKIPDPERALFVRLAFELYSTKMFSFDGLILELTRRGFRNRSGKPISRGCLENMMSNPFYHGLIRVKRTGATYKGIHEPLISTALFIRVQDIKSNKQIKKETMRNHTYRQLVKCSNCQYSLIGEKQKERVYYRCHTKGCGSSIREDRLELAISNKLMCLKLSPADKKRLEIRGQRWIKQDQAGDQNRSIQLQLAKNAERLEQLTDALLDKLIDKSTFDTRKQKLLAEQIELEGIQSEHVSTANKHQHITKYLELIKNLYLTYGLANGAQKRRLAELAMSNFQIIGKNLCFEPRKWLLDPQYTLRVLCGSHGPDRTRILDDLESAISTVSECTMTDRNC